MAKSPTGKPRWKPDTDALMKPIAWSGSGRSKEARLFRIIRRELIDHIGGNPSAAERHLIDRCAMLQVHLAKQDERLLNGADITQNYSNQYLAWANSVSRMLQAIGLKAPSAKEMTAADSVRILREQYGVGGEE